MRSITAEWMAATIGMNVIRNLDDIDHNMSFGLIEPSPSVGTKRSVGDKAHRAFNKTRLYRPNGARECARRARQAAALQSKTAA